MRNLMWDEKEHKWYLDFIPTLRIELTGRSYIVDFEDYEYIDFDLNPVTFWGDCRYRAYDISEECKRTI
jgi:hypothetical protein